MEQYDVVIAGAGTAGLTSAIYVQRAGLKSLVLEQLTYGGQIVNSPKVDNYPGLPHVNGFDFADALYHQALDLGATVAFEKVRSIEEGEKGTKVVRTQAHEYTAKAVILATGVRNRYLMENEEGREEEKALTGHGISYCAACDGMFFRGKTVAVVGGGNTALEDALFLSKLCKKVYLIHRRNEFRGDKSTAEKLKETENVELVLSSKVTAFQTAENNGHRQLSGIEVVQLESGEKRELALDGLFVAVGQVPENQAFASLVELDEKGYIKAGEDCVTSAPGVFAAGDCRTKAVRQLVTAASDGAQAALAACGYANRLQV